MNSQFPSIRALNRYVDEKTLDSVKSSFDPERDIASDKAFHRAAVQQVAIRRTVRYLVAQDEGPSMDVITEISHHCRAHEYIAAAVRESSKVNCAYDNLDTTQRSIRATIADFSAEMAEGGADLPESQFTSGPWPPTRIVGAGSPLVPTVGATRDRSVSTTPETSQ